MMAAPRSRAERIIDTLAKLSDPVADGWVSTASGDEPYLVPLTLLWHQDRIVLATSATSPTVRNLERSGRARIALGGTRDVVLIRADLEQQLPVTDPGGQQVGAAYAQHNDWDPRAAGPGYVFVWLRPVTIQAWREENELADRLVMRAGAWLD